MDELRVREIMQLIRNGLSKSGNGDFQAFFGAVLPIVKISKLDRENDRHVIVAIYDLYQCLKRYGAVFESTLSFLASALRRLPKEPMRRPELPYFTTVAEIKGRLQEIVAEGCELDEYEADCLCENLEMAFNAFIASLAELDETALDALFEFTRLYIYLRSRLPKTSLEIASTLYELLAPFAFCAILGCG